MSTAGANSLTEPVLVTGGAGFIGSHLVEVLAREGAHVYVLDNLQAGRWENVAGIVGSVSRINGDTRSAADVDGVVKDIRPSAIYHFAANASVPASVDDPLYDFETNAAGTCVVLDAARRYAPGARVVVASSGAVYGEPREFPLTESSPLAPISPYGVSKLCAESVGGVFHRTYGLDVVFARIFNTYGPRMPRFVVLDFLKKLRVDVTELEILGSGRQVRDFSYVDDTVRGVLAIRSRGAAGEAYNVASGTSCSVTELAEMLLRTLGLEGRTRLKYSGSSWCGDAQRWEVSVGKLRRIGHVALQTLEDGLRAVLDWFINENGPCDTWPLTDESHS